MIQKEGEEGGGGGENTNEQMEEHMLRYIMDTT